MKKLLTSLLALALDWGAEDRLWLEFLRSALLPLTSEVGGEGGG